jgi:peptide chain release factor
MEIQLSSGQGPDECELAVGKLLRALELEFQDISVIDAVRGRRPDSYRSVRISSGSDLSFLEGTVKWVCESPYRPQHQRKNWFVDISLCAKQSQLMYDEELVRFETFRSGGKGGQHVNKVETGVRAIYVPTGLAVTSTEARSQHLNKRIALNRLCEAITQQNNYSAVTAQALNRLEHSRIERGNPVRIYVGMDFRRLDE